VFAHQRDGLCVRAYNHGTHYVPWAWIRDHEQHPLRLDRPAGDLPHLRDIPGPPSEGGRHQAG